MNENANTLNLQIERTIFLSEIINLKAYLNGKKIGKLYDVIIVETGKLPEVTYFYIKRPFGLESLLVPIEKINKIEKKSIELGIDKIETYIAEPKETDVMLKDHIVDKKVIDLDDHEVEVVYDVKMQMIGNKIFVVAVDFSKYGFLRRIGLKNLVHKIYNYVFILAAKEQYAKRASAFSKYLIRLANKLKEQTLPWTVIQPLPNNIGRFKGNVKLSILKENLSDIPPVVLADILEELDNQQRVMIFEELETEHASDTLEEIDPNVQRELVSSMHVEKVAQLVDEMTPAQAADVLGVLPTSTANDILELLDPENANKVKSILEQQEEKITDYATKEFIKFPPDMPVEKAEDEFRLAAKEKDIIMYLYIVDENNRLIGVVDLKELLQANENALLKDIMVDNVVTLAPDNSLREASALFQRYGFRAIPVVDPSDEIIGVIPYRDIMNLKHRFVE